MNKRGFTLLEMMAVVLLILLITAAAGITFANSRPAVRVKRDAALTVSFLRNMWDRARTSGSALVLAPDFETGELSYVDPRTGKRKKAQFVSGAHVVGIQLNDRLFNAYSHLAVVSGDEEDGEEETQDPDADVLYISEQRGLVRLTVIFALPLREEDDDEDISGYEHITACTLNLINGKGKIIAMEENQLEEILAPQTDVEDDY